jgi:hypothetical protein
MDSKELAKLVDWGTTHNFDSWLVQRHGKIVAEAYYAPYAARVPHRVYSVTKAVIGTLTAIAWKDGVLDSLNHRVLDFFDPRSIANVDQKKEAITALLRLSKRIGKWLPASTGSNSFSIGLCRALPGTPSTMTVGIRICFPPSLQSSQG